MSRILGEIRGLAENRSCMVYRELPGSIPFYNRRGEPHKGIRGSNIQQNESKNQLSCIRSVFGIKAGRSLQDNSCFAVILGQPSRFGVTRSGMTMVEIAIAVVVLALSLLPILSTFMSSHRNTRFTLEEVIASNFATELMEAIQALPYACVQPVSETKFTIDSAGNLVSYPLGTDPFALARSKGIEPCLATKNLPKRFSVYLTVSSFPNSGVPIADADLARIVVRIEWQTRGKRTKLMTFKGKW